MNLVKAPERPSVIYGVSLILSAIFLILVWAESAFLVSFAIEALAKGVSKPPRTWSCYLFCVLAPVLILIPIQLWRYVREFWQAKRDPQ